MTNTPTILLIEDEQDLLATLKDELNHSGYSILTATNGVEALAILDNNATEVDVVVSDWIMEEMDGMELLEKMRAECRFRDIPFLMLTAKGYEEDVIKGFSAGANDFVKKPFNFNEFLARVGNLVKSVELQRHLKEQAIRDELTRLYNYRYFSAQLKREVERQERYGGELSLMIFDIDHFKSFNDKYGHLTGDFILSNLGRLILKNFRKVDIPCRYGGEEFVVILPGTGINGASILAERVRKVIAEENFQQEDISLNITCSFGVSQWCTGDKPQELLKRVDKALYSSKDRGRNLVTLASA